MMVRYFQEHPALCSVLIMILGIIAGHYIDALPSSFYFLDCLNITHSVAAYAAVTTLILLPIVAIVIRYRFISTLLLACCLFLLGIFLIKGERHTYSVPYGEQVTAFMDEQRENLSNIIQQQGLTEEDYALVTAVTLGEKQNLSYETKQEYSICSASHVLAISGLHMGIIFLFLSKIVPMLITLISHKYTDKISSFIIIFCIWTYVLLIGNHPSTMRAAIMLTMYLLTQLFTQYTDKMSILTFTAGLLLIIYPEWLFDIGFQMSFFAVLAILYIFIPLSERIHNAFPSSDFTYAPSKSLCDIHIIYHTKCALREIALIIIDALLLSIVAEIAVGPLIAYYFGQFSTYFWLTNLIVPMLTTACIYLTIFLFIADGVATLLYFIPFHDSPAAIITNLLSCVAHIQNACIHFVSHLPYASFENINLNLLQMILIYFYIIILAFWVDSHYFCVTLQTEPKKCEINY